MRELILCVQITNDIFPELPAGLQETQTPERRVSDLDQRSGGEVIQTAREAIDLAESLVVFVIVKDGTLDLGPLLGIFKRCVAKGEQMQWIQVGSHPKLSIFRKKMHPADFPNPEDALEFLVSQLQA